MTRTEAKIRCGCGFVLLAAFPAWMYFMIDKPMLVYIYSVVPEVLLGVYLSITGLGGFLGE